jgi:hypothetical protein
MHAPVFRSIKRMKSPISRVPVITGPLQAALLT